MARLRARRRELDVARATEHVAGPVTPGGTAPAPVVLTLVRDGAEYLTTYFAHHRALGIRHFVLMDNGSRDDTPERAAAEPGVTLLRCRLPYARYQHAMQRHLAACYGRGRWCLSLDVDELFDYPQSAALSFDALLSYLTAHRYTGVVAQMLDMFPDAPLVDVPAAPNGDFRSLHRFYDLSDVVKRPYSFPDNALATPLQTYFNGVRGKVFGIEWLMLTKHPLFLYDERIEPWLHTIHGIGRARIADLTAVLYHYKFVWDLAARSDKYVLEGNHYRNSLEYQQYQRILRAEPRLTLRRDTSRELGSVQDLVQSGFLIESEALRAAARSAAADGGR